LHRIQKKLSQGKWGAKVRSSSQDGGRKSRTKKLITKKYGRGEKADSDEDSYAIKKDSNLCWEKKDTQVLCYIFQQFIQVVVNFELIDLLYYNLLSKMNWISNYHCVDHNVVMSSRMQKVIC